MTELVREKGRRKGLSDGRFSSKSYSNFSHKCYMHTQYDICAEHNTRNYLQRKVRSTKFNTQSIYRYQFL